MTLPSLLNSLDSLRTLVAAIPCFNPEEAIAELDLAERNYGDLIGQRQSGGEELRVARLPDDTDLLEVSRRMAQEVLAADPTLDRPANRPLKQRAVERYPRADILFRVG